MNCAVCKSKVYLNAEGGLELTLHPGPGLKPVPKGAICRPCSKKAPAVTPRLLDSCLF